MHWCAVLWIDLKCFALSEVLRIDVPCHALLCIVMYWCKVLCINVLRIDVPCHALSCSVMHWCTVLLECWVLWTNTLFPAARLANHSSGRLAGVLNTQQTWSMEICNYAFCRKCGSWFMLWQRPGSADSLAGPGHKAHTRSHWRSGNIEILY